MLSLFGFWQDQIMYCDLLPAPTGPPLPQLFQESLEEEYDSTQISALSPSVALTSCSGCSFVFILC